MNLRKHKNFILISFVSVCVVLLISAYLFNESIHMIVNIIVISFIIAYTLMPIREAIKIKFGISKKASSILIIFVIISVIAASIIVIVPALFTEISNVTNIFENINEFLNSFLEKNNLNNFAATSVIYNEVLEKLNTFWIGFSENAVENLMNIGDNAMSFAIMPIMVYYFLCDGSKLYSKLLLILPTAKRGMTKKVLSNIDRVLTRYITSQLMLSGLIGILTLILLLVLKVKFPLWISILNAILNIIPYFGPIFGAAPAVIVALLDSPIKALWVILGMFIIQQIEGDILSPKITGDSTEMHPFVIIILLLIGDKAGGFLGMILVVPIAVIIKVLYDDINYYLF